MESDREGANADLAAAVDLVDRLFEAADGGRHVSVGEYEASTILALFADSQFRENVLSTHLALPPDSASEPATR